MTLSGVTKQYPSAMALHEVDLSFVEGITGLLGENGAGKSTMIKILLGLIPPTSGSVRVLGEDVTRNPLVRSRLGYMPEHDCLPVEAPAAEFLCHMAEVSGLPATRARMRAADTLRHVGLFEARHRSMGSYSTGMKQRVKLAQALVHDPDIVLLNEPAAGLDPAGRDDMLDLVRRTYREFGITVVFSSHLMSDVERTCDRITVLEGGRVARAGEVAEYTAETRTLFIEVDGNRERFVAALKARGIPVGLADGGIAVQGFDEELYDLVRDALVEAEAPLRRMAPRRRELAELFTGVDDPRAVRSAEVDHGPAAEDREAGGEDREPTGADR
ncbi:MAG: ABC transporter ATP-binding protein [Gemmatimonadota bacterium]|nr:ABC transporter ATP-binding protein [Gemmatimonadota bacterium]